MLVKAFTDDFSWQVQEQLADAYFEAQRVLSPAEQLLNQANVLVQHDQRLNLLEQNQQSTTKHLLDTRQEVRDASTRADQAFSAASAALAHKFGDKDFYTVMAFCRAKNIPISGEQARIKGIQASQKARANNGLINRVPDERYGTVNAYHVSILETIFHSELNK